jgi:hypothetical protein
VRAGSYLYMTLAVLLVWLVPRGGPLPCYAAASNTTSLNVTVNGDKPWVDTGMEVKAGDKLHITAKGTVDFPDKTGVGPEGAARGWKDTLRALSVSSAGRGALVGQIGTDRAATPFLVGADGTVLAPVAGRLYLGVNQDQYSKPTGGKFEVHIDRVAAAAATASGAAASASNYDFKPLFAELEKSLPSRVSDKAENGNAGDLVNFVLVGDQEQVIGAFKSAGWVQADKTNTDAVVGALLATLQKQVYVTVPMSTLYLFGRGQDFGYARAQAVEVAAQRDHFRIWKAPFEGPNSEVVWAGAGTHDIGIEQDKRSENAITHKIDPEVDKERDFIGATLQQAGWVQAMSYMDRGANAIKQTFTATGGEIKSDGRVLVIVLKAVPAAK